MPAGDGAMAVLQSAALDSIDRMTPYNIASTVWALGKLLRMSNGAAFDGPSPSAPCPVSGRPASTSASSSVMDVGQRQDSVEGRPRGGDPCLGLQRPSYPAAGAGYASSDSDAGALSSGEDLLESWGTGGGSHQPMRPHGQGSGADGTSGRAADVLRLLDGLVAATARGARQFKPAHVGDVLWGFGCLGLSPGDDAVSDLLLAAAAARETGLWPANAACALVGLSELAALGGGSAAGSSSARWLTEHRVTLGVLASTAGAGFASLRTESAEEVCFGRHDSPWHQRTNRRGMCGSACPGFCRVLTIAFRCL